MIEFHAPGTFPTDSVSCVVRIPRGIADKPDLLRHIAAKLNFPDYFGFNWDALDECLADLSWLQAREAYRWHEEIPLSDEPAEARRYLQALREVLREPGSVQLRISFPETIKAELDALLG
jgi:RNAse (barnase) inhibitor barstar